jgi:hypothetical protein
VVAVVHAAHLNDQIAAKAWWAMPSSDNARRMLYHKEVVEGETGPKLAEYLVEFLPFEEEQWAIGESVKLILQPGLISDEAREKLWGQGKRKNTYLLGFLAADPDELPLEVAASRAYAYAEEKLGDLGEAGNIYAQLLLRLLSAKGQAFLKTLDLVVKKPVNQDVVVGYLRVIQHYFQSITPDCTPREGVNNTRLYAIEGSEVDMQSLIRLAADYIDEANDAAINDVLGKVPEFRKEIEGMLALSMVSERVVNPIFARTDAIGSLMRKKLEPVSGPLLELSKIIQTNPDFQ